MDIEPFLTELAEILEISPSSISPETELASLASWDSVNVLTYIVFVDEKFGHEIVPDEIEKAKTVGDLYRIAKGKTAA